MKINHGRVAGEPSAHRDATFTGAVWSEPLLRDVPGVIINTVFFPPGVRTHWHRHETGQILIVTHGRGHRDAPVRLGRDIQRDRANAFAQFLGQRRGLVGEHVADHHVRPLAGQRPHVGVADPAGATRHDRHTPLQTGLCHPITAYRSSLTASSHSVVPSEIAMWLT